MTSPSSGPLAIASCLPSREFTLIIFPGACHFCRHNPQIRGAPGLAIAADARDLIGFPIAHVVPAAEPVFGDIVTIDDSNTGY